MTRTYKLVEGNLQHRFQKSRAKIRIFGGGFGNGKTTAAVILGLQLARDYPGSNGLIARSTFPKLNDTIRKEFLAWCPDKWKKRVVASPDNLCELQNGSIINFRYIAQQGKSGEQSSSNLLSATYDWIVIDQMEDPEISHKDFLDLMGRLRGQTKYDGDDDTMPRTGPRWLIACVNPTRNWVYKKLVKPLQDLKAGIRNPDLYVDAEGNPLIELFEGSTYENKDNLPVDFIEGLESTYQGQMRERYLMGLWGAFEGLVYPMYDQMIHMLDHQDIVDYLHKITMQGYQVKWIESYDHGMASASCYSLAFCDGDGNVFDLDGFYEKEKTPEQLVKLIKDVRRRYDDFLPDEMPAILADPAIFKRGTGSTKTVGVTVAGMFAEMGIKCARASNDIVSGIGKVQSYLSLDKGHRHPILGTFEAPRLYFSANQTWIDREISEYIWKRDTGGEFEDKPRDINDHAMDRIKYMLTHRPRIAMLKPRQVGLPPKYMRWGERQDSRGADNRRHRHAA